MNELKPCIFKNVEKEIGHQVYLTNDGLAQIHCSCGASGPIMATDEQACRAWNSTHEGEQIKKKFSGEEPICPVCQNSEMKEYVTLWRCRDTNCGFKVNKYF